MLPVCFPARGCPAEPGDPVPTGRKDYFDSLLKFYTAKIIISVYFSDLYNIF
jgi:hypothetical protein